MEAVEPVETAAHENLPPVHCSAFDPVQLERLDPKKLVVEASVAKKDVDVASEKSAFTKWLVVEAKMPFSAHRGVVVADVLTP